MSVQMTGPCYLLLEGSKDPVLFSEWHEEAEVMIRGKIQTPLAIFLMHICYFACLFSLTTLASP
jgi:hypothetical protein